MQIPNLYAIIAGRFVLGLGCGCISVVVPKFVSEISPPSISGVTGMMSQFMITFGILLSFLVSFIAVPLQDADNFDKNQGWRIVFGFPVLLSLLQVPLLLFVFRLDSPKFYEVKGRQDMVNKCNKAIFKDSDAVINEKDGDEGEPLTDHSADTSASNLGQKWADLLLPKFRYALFVGCSLSMIQ